MKKIIACLLACLMVVSVILVGCSGSEGSKETEGSKREITETQENRIYPNLPDVTYDGNDVNIAEFDCYDGALIRDLLVDEEDDSRIAGEILNRNTRIEDKYKVKLNVEMLDLDVLSKRYEETVNSGDAVYDVVYSRGHEMQMYLKAGYCLDLHKLKYCDFTQPWWDAESVKQFTLGDKLYMAESDVTLRDKNGTACVFFNKAVQEDRGIGDIYGLVKNDEWTFEKMIALGKKATFDNGDSVWDENDTYGLVADDDLTYMMLHGGGARFATKDEDNLPVPGFNDARTKEVAQAVLDIIFDETYFYHLQRRTNTDVHPFQEDRALFFVDALFRGQGFNDMSTDFGIMPVPKYDENQKSYGHSVSVHFSNVLTVPKTCRDLDRTSVILEALSADSKYTVLPEFYDVYVKTRNTRDEEAKAMLDIIFATRVYDFGEFFNFGTFNTVYLRVWSQYKVFRNVATLYEKFAGKVEADISNFIEQMEVEDMYE